MSGAFIDAMGMIADIVRPTHGHFAIEHPGYHIARKVFAHHGFEMTPIGKENDAYIIEDDYDSELTYRSRPIPSLQGLDDAGRVIYIGTFAKALSPALRIGYVVLPHALFERYKAFHGTFARVGLMSQKTLELFMREGHWERHLRRVRNQSRKKHDLMKQALISHLGDTVEIVSEGGGLAINIRPTCHVDYDLLSTKAEEAGIKLYFAKEYSGGEWEALRMGFGGFEMGEIEEAVAAVAKIFLRGIE